MFGGMPQAWGDIQHTLQWLQNYGHPTQVSGAKHREEVWHSVKLMVGFTDNQAPAHLADSITKQGGVQSLLALLKECNPCHEEVTLKVNNWYYPRCLLCSLTTELLVELALSRQWCSI